MDVLVTDGMMKKSLAVVRSIAPLTASTGVASAYPLSMAGVSRTADARHRVRQESPAEYVAELNEVIDRHGYEYLVPVGGWTTNVLSERREELAVPVDGVLPPNEAMRIAQDKLRTYHLARALDVPVPDTVRVDANGGVDAAASRLGYPLVVKARTESLPRYVEYAADEAEFREAVAEYRERYDEDPLAQERVTGEGCGFFALYLGGERVGGYSHRRIREYPPSGGISACSESLLDERLTELGTRVLDALNWNGPVMVEFKRDADGDPKLIEINPKFWGSLDLGIGSGLDFPSALVNYLDDGSLPEFSFTPRRFHWPLSGDLQHAIARPSAARDVAADLLSLRTRSNVSVTDPLPHVVEGGKAVVSPFLAS